MTSGVPRTGEIAIGLGAFDVAPTDLVPAYELWTARREKWFQVVRARRSFRGTERRWCSYTFSTTRNRSHRTGRSTCDAPDSIEAIVFRRRPTWHEVRGRTSRSAPGAYGKEC